MRECGDCELAFTRNSVPATLAFKSVFYSVLGPPITGWSGPNVNHPTIPIAPKGRASTSRRGPRTRHHSPRTSVAAGSGRRRRARAARSLNDGAKSKTFDQILANKQRE
jgi:hypothetical protein